MRLAFFAQLRRLSLDQTCLAIGVTSESPNCKRAQEAFSPKALFKTGLKRPDAAAKAAETTALRPYKA